MTGWIGDERARLAADKILDAAARLFAERGVGSVGMGEIATAAGCSRATLYRYFADRGQLHMAFVHREAVRVGQQVAAEVRAADVADPAEAVTVAVLGALRRVRETPALAAWFRLEEAATSAGVAQSSAVIEALGLSIVTDPLAARWLVRVVLSLLTVPGRDEAEERAMVERFVGPVVLGASSVRPA
ncbi:MAG: helix-turn-helix domain-containing protein [Nocardioides sp.]|nr:helix-turn-helix domain-containing protein [Nocardioides sp.]